MIDNHKYGNLPPFRNAAKEKIMTFQHMHFVYVYQGQRAVLKRLPKGHWDPSLAQGFSHYLIPGNNPLPN